jgi:hypothetical protein
MNGVGREASEFCGDGVGRNARFTTTIVPMKKVGSNLVTHAFYPIPPPV